MIPFVVVVRDELAPGRPEERVAVMEEDPEVSPHARFSGAIRTMRRRIVSMTRGRPGPRRPRPSYCLAISCRCQRRRVPGRDQGVPVTAYPSPEALGVGDPEPARTELLSEGAILFLESVNDVTWPLVDPARDGHDEELQHVGKRRQTGRASQRLSAVTNVATRRASRVESARRTASIGFLDSSGSRKLIATWAVPIIAVSRSPMRAMPVQVLSAIKVSRTR